MSKAQEKRIESKLKEVLALAKQLYLFTPINLTIKYKTKGRAAGQASYNYRTNKMGLMFNLEALEKDAEHLLNETIPHEVAHLVCYSDPCLGRNHDYGWKTVCRRLGGSGERCHSIDLTPAKVTQKFTYVASCGSKVEVSKIIHNRIQRGVAGYYALERTKGKLLAKGWVK